ncbi:MAG: alanine racemase, partial [Clostridiales bacterium]|nr:alanine racemase [Clostridiales bacterium]
MRDGFGRSVAEVDLGRISANIGIARELVSAGVMIMTVVKANAYGHGLLEVSGAALRAGSSWLAVATAHE